MLRARMIRIERECLLAAHLGFEIPLGPHKAKAGLPERRRRGCV